MAYRLPKSWRLLILTVGLAALVPGLHGQHRGAPKKLARETIETLEEQWRQAQLADDATAMDKLLADDYVGIGAGGQVATKAQQLDRMRDRSATISMLNVSDVKIKLVGQQVAIVTSLAELQGTNNSAPFSGTFRSTRVYQRLPGGTWKITSFEATRVPVNGAKAQAETAAKP